MSSFRVQPVDFADTHSQLHAIRETVFIQGQGVPAELERDALDPECRHVLAVDTDDTPIGTARLTADGRIGRMAVLPAWRGKGVGAAMLAELVQIARDRSLDSLHLHAQLPVRGFYLRQGWLPRGENFIEAGIEHRDMALPLRSALQFNEREAAQAALCGVIGATRRQLRLRDPQLVPAIFDAPMLLDALRAFATGVRNAEARILIHNAQARDSANGLLALVQRLPSVFQLRVVEQTEDLGETSAWACNDRSGYVLRNDSQRLAGEYALDLPATARRLRSAFDSAWERARPAVEFRALGI